MKKITLILLAFLPLMASAQFTYDLQGHRGSRGLMPENTIPAMIKALDLGATTLELDLAVTKDGQPVVSHETYMNPLTVLDPDGNEIEAKDHSHNIHQMTYGEVIQYDCGSKFNSDFPQQVKFFTTKPKLEDLIAVVEKYVKDMGLPAPKYNIEIKSSSHGDGINHPKVDEFSELFIRLLKETIGFERGSIQSFDFRVLKYIDKHYPVVVLAMLVSDASGYEKQLDDLGFQPEIYSPNFVKLTSDAVKRLHEIQIKVIPWTLNTTQDMNRLLDMNVDGIITDYPNLAPNR